MRTEGARRGSAMPDGRPVMNGTAAACPGALRACAAVMRVFPPNATVSASWMPGHQRCRSFGDKVAEAVRDGRLGVREPDADPEASALTAAAPARAGRPRPR